MMFMLICKGLYIANLCGGLFYFTTARRQADWFCVAFASAAIYFMAGLLGETSIPIDSLRVSAGCYFVMALVMGAIWYAAILRDHETIHTSRSVSRLPVPGRPVQRKPISDNYYALTATILQLVGFYLALKISGSALLAQNKHEMARTFTPYHLLWLMGAPTAFIISVYYKRYLLALINLASLLGILFIGSRNQLAIGVIGAMTIWLARRGVNPLIKHKKICITIVLFTSFIFLYKTCYIFLKAGDFDGASARMSEKGTDAFIKSEPVAIQHILNVVIEEDYRMDAWERLELIVMSNISSGITSSQAAFGDTATYELFGDVGYGMASNIWAEGYAYGGMIGVGIFVLGYVLVIFISQMPQRYDFVQVFFVSFMPWWCFYIHRNDIYRMISFSKQLIAFLVVVAVASRIVKGLATLYFSSRQHRSLPNPALTR
ncbi:hypothetical protein [Rubinisphaera margarita]|uniref:hypothetical protein n=1 Tax=Rubinisphaera margarita TaxID=2909586 RepID=UPI001EE9A48D|nr:hypothetical protein [Rubinisphaera margarita]MCG6155226.1 hypothetical protein [Rubinisphaera margarita]